MLTEEYCASHLSVPLLVGTSVIGALCVSSRTPQHFSEHHREPLARLADLAAIAINNARLLEGERNLAVREERDRLAREMHDSLAQVLGSLHLKAQAAQRTLSRQDVVGAEAKLNEVTSLAHEAYVDVREAIQGLRQTVSPRMGIIVILREYLQKFSGQSGIKVELSVEEDAMPQFSPEVEVQLIRVIQEALTNVRKHANADTAWVRVRRGDVDFSICIEDNGEGFEPGLIHGSAGHRFGVQIMRERIEKVGGRFGIDSGPGRGTRVQICLPLGEREE
jgi:signal transduction histidine kinase